MPHGNAVSNLVGSASLRNQCMQPDHGSPARFALVEQHRKTNIATGRMNRIDWSIR
jgi:hypothetical protein